jgi:hypothetical protein
MGKSRACKRDRRRGVGITGKSSALFQQTAGGGESTVKITEHGSVLQYVKTENGRLQPDVLIVRSLV